MPKSRLTKARVEALKPRDAPYVEWDHGVGAIAGFGVRVRPNGARTFVFAYRLKGLGRKGNTRWYRIGAFGPKMPFAKAKARAKSLAASVEHGGDPINDDRKRAAETQDREKNAKERTFGVLAEAWLKSKGERRDKKTGKIRRKARRSLPQFRLLVATHLQELLSMEAAAITSGDVERIIRAIEDRAPFMAKQVLWATKGIFQRGVGDWLTVNPAAQIKVETGAEPGGRDRTLNDEELKAIWLAATKDPSHFGPIVRLLILTAARISEVAGMSWSEVDLDAGIWKIPAARAKNKLEHTLHLSAPAIQILKALPGPHAGLVFTTNGTAPFSAISKAKTRLDRTSQVTGWRLHDIRRTMATGLHEMNFGLQVVERLLNHVGASRSGVAGIYNKADHLPERKRAMDVWGASVQALVEGKTKAGNVVAISSSRMG